MESAKAIDKVAGDWLAKRDSGVWTAADQSAFDHWLNASALNRVAFLRLENAWEQALRLKALGAGVAADKVPPPGQWVLSPFDLLPPARRRRIALPALAASAAAVAILAVATYFLWPQGAYYSTPVGGVASVPMADGSKITLNTDSEVHVSLDEKERRVELDRGEAFFEVAPDPRRLFVVHAGDKRIVAVGTQFSVRRERDEVRVVVTEGRVRVEVEGEPQPATRETLSAGAVALAGSAVKMQYKPLPEAEEALSWRSGILVFRDLTLAEAAEEFNRYNTRKVIVEDANIAGLRVAGSFRSTNVSAFLRLLEQGYPLRVEREGERIVLKKH